MLAEKQVFNMEGKNPIDSVRETNLYHVMTYLSWITAKNTYEIKKLISLSEKKRTSVIVNYSDLFNENFNFLISKKKLIGKIKFIEASFGKYSEKYKSYSQQPSQDWLSHPLSLILEVFITFI